MPLGVTYHMLDTENIFVLLSDYFDNLTVDEISSKSQISHS